jgi:hypothetical protein
MLLAAARRILRAGDPLSPIASLHYIRPVIQELLAQPVDPDYIHYIYRKLAPFVPDFASLALQLQ